MRARRPTAKQRSRARQQFRKGERLYEVIVRAQFEASHPLVHGVASGKKKHRHALALLAQSSENLPSIETGKHHVENNQIEFQLLGEMQPVQSICCNINDET